MLIEYKGTSNQGHLFTFMLTNECYDNMYSTIHTMSNFIRQCVRPKVFNDDTFVLVVHKATKPVAKFNLDENISMRVIPLHKMVGLLENMFAKQFIWMLGTGYFKVDEYLRTLLSEGVFQICVYTEQSKGNRFQHVMSSIKYGGRSPFPDVDPQKKREELEDDPFHTEADMVSLAFTKENLECWADKTLAIKITY